MYGESNLLKTNATGGCLAYHEERIKLTNMYGHRSTSRLDVRGVLTINRQSSVASYHGSVKSAVMVCCWKSYYREQRMVVVEEEDRVNHGRTALRNGQASWCRHCCASGMTEVMGSHHSGVICRSTPATPGRHGNQLDSTDDGGW